ncbi:methylenetetrahydrofolate reductase [NAD(P)H] [Candidatus Nitrosacidococcus sp. I8]|uniref:methylenetetrahydrofolate reductase [NAD(P)H] n=1 Tax=Candidatus Nitrosacidococcus sp. I8 TaxID=2942908 RepID=UPI002227DE39|nr:methylenetetrahydrofolate reductase [NAD(P)H] [Candidatus Nitrosacidococcus sp. I8]CAH9019501.1 5,10-methylenetetrahydrofolate reductase [Candidatus Nitrosacidococcus sp. I8]
MSAQKKKDLVFSCEFFPPRTEKGIAKLKEVRGQLSIIGPRYYSVTFGAGGSTRDRTFETVLEIQGKDQGSKIESAPHLSCIGASRSEIKNILTAYKQHGVSHVVALRGDLPSGTVDYGDFHYANHLVEFIRAQTGDYFHIEVGAYPEVHPQAKSAQTDLINFKRKVDAGANGAVTQYFYNVDAYLRFVDCCLDLGISIPIVPGIMPIHHYPQLARFSDICGAEIPRWLRKRLENFSEGEDEALLSFTTDVLSHLCQQLLDAGAPGLHFYTLNRAEPTLAIWHNLGLSTKK